MLVSRMFTSSEDAAASVGDLKTYGLRQDFIKVIEGAVSEAGLMEHGIVAEHASEYSAALAAGGALVVVDAPLGTAKPVGIILERMRPGDTGTPQSRPETTASFSREAQPGDPAAPFSSYLGWKVLLHDPAPLSNWLKWRTLSPKQDPSISLMENPAPLSSKIGMKVLSENPAPLSSAAKMQVLLDDPAPLSHKIKMPVLLDEPAPLSAKANMKTLSDNPAPLSSMLGWKTLLNDPAPLSRLLNWPVLSKKQ